MSALYTRAIGRIIALAVAMGLLLFGPAGTVRYWQASVYLAIFTGASLLLSFYLARNDPALLERRMRGGPRAEKEPTQKVIMVLVSFGFSALLIVPGLDYRFGWSSVPAPVQIAGDLLVAIGFYCVFLVYRENSFTSSTIEVAENQKVVSTGPYALVRHPLYASSLLHLVGLPLALGSYWAFLAVVFVVFVLVWRLVAEERFLATNLPGYAEYQKKVVYRLVPRVW